MQNKGGITPLDNLEIEAVAAGESMQDILDRILRGIWPPTRPIVVEPGIPDDGSL